MLEILFDFFFFSNILQSRKDCDFSFAGLKNAFRLAVTQAVEDYKRARGPGECSSAETKAGSSSSSEASTGDTDEAQTVEDRG